MYKVLVVDDEPLVRLAFKSLVNWESIGFKVIQEANNGKHALKVLQDEPDIDIIVTDINMPVMNGLEMIAEVHRRDVMPEILVLSAYNDYNQVRQAFKLGIYDYILKTEMNPDSIITLFNALKDYLEHKKDQPSREYRSGSVDTRVLKEQVLKNLLDSSNSYTLEQVHQYEIRLNEKNIVLCFIWLDDYQMISERYDNHNLKTFVTAIHNGIQQVLDTNKLGEVISLSPQEHLVLFSFAEVSGVQLREKLLDLLGQIKHALWNYLNVNVSIGVSTVRNGINQIHLLYRQAESNARLRFAFGKGHIIFPEDAERIGDTSGASILGHENDFIAALKEVNPDRTLKELQKLLNLISQSKTGRINKIYPLYMELIFILANFLLEREEDLVDVIGKELNFYEKIAGFETQAEINTWMEELVMNIVNYLQGKRDLKVNRAVARAQEFIKNNYHHDLTLKMVSDYVGLSESHFSNLFTKITRESFIDYLTKIRIEKAKELLTATNLKIYEIAAKVGYSSIEHFSRVFKKITGVSPNSYRS